MTIRKRGRKFSVEIYDGSLPTRKRYVGTYPTEKEAKKAARDAEALLEQRQGQKTETIQAFSERWLDLFPRRKQSTNLSYREQIKPYVARHGQRRLADVTVRDALTWERARDRQRRWFPALCVLLVAVYVAVWVVFT